MNTGKFVFSQLTDFVNKYEFNKCVNKGFKAVSTFIYFKFLNVEIPVPSYEDKEKGFDKDKAINKIKQTAFYKMIEKL